MDSILGGRNIFSGHHGSDVSLVYTFSSESKTSRRIIGKIPGWCKRSLATLLGDSDGNYLDLTNLSRRYRQIANWPEMTQVGISAKLVQLIIQVCYAVGPIAQ